MPSHQLDLPGGVGLFLGGECKTLFQKFPTDVIRIIEEIHSGLFHQEIFCPLLERLTNEKLMIHTNRSYTWYP